MDGWNAENAVRRIPGSGPAGHVLAPPDEDTHESPDWTQELRASGAAILSPIWRRFPSRISFSRMDSSFSRIFWPVRAKPNSRARCLANSSASVAPFRRAISIAQALTVSYGPIGRSPLVSPCVGQFGAPAIARLQQERDAVPVRPSAVAGGFRDACACRRPSFPGCCLSPIRPGSGPSARCG